jgi:putative inorganic carbon (HCO3(-)) transporter
MSFLNNFSSWQYFPSGRKLLLALSAVLCIAISVGVFAARGPFFVALAIAGILLAFVLVVWPDASTLAVFFVLYTNAAAVAVRFHNVPFVVGAAVPLLFVIPLANYLIIRRKKLIFHPLLPFIGLFLLVQIISALQAIKLSESFLELVTFISEGLGLYFLITNVVRTPKTLRRVVWTLLIAGGLIGGLTTYQQFTKTFDNNYGGFAQVSNAAFGTGQQNLLGEVVQPRLAGPIGEQNRYAQIMLMLVPLGLFRMWGERSLKLRALAAVATAFISLGVLLTFSRGAAIGFMLLIAIMLITRYIKIYQIAIILMGAFVLIQVVPSYKARLSSLNVFTDLLSQGSSANLAEADGSIRSRLTEMGAAGLVFIDHPFVGVGPGMFKYYYRTYAERIGLRVLNADREAHSLFPGLAAEVGGLGVLAFVIILYLTLRDLIRVRRKLIRLRPEEANYATAFILSIVSYLMTGLFLHNGYIRFFWTIMALASVVSYLFNSERSSEWLLEGK